MKLYVEKPLPVSCIIFYGRFGRELQTELRSASLRLRGEMNRNICVYNCIHLFIHTIRMCLSVCVCVTS